MRTWKPKVLTALVLCTLSTFTFAQGVGINTSGNPADPSAMLDVNSIDKGLLPPRMTTAQRNAIANPASGLMIYNTDTDCYNMYNGGTWRQSCYECDFSAPTVGNNGPICEGSTLNLTATPVIGATYSWAGPNGFTSTSQNPSIANATAAAGGLYSLVVTVNGCSANAVTTVVTVNATPQTPVAGNDGPVCSGGTLNLTASNIVGATYSWTGPNGYSSSDQNPTINNIAVSNAGNYNVSVVVNGCTSANGSTSVTVNTAPSTPGSISGSTNHCANQSGVVYSISSVPTATSYIWTVPSGATVASGQGTASASVDFGGTGGNVCVTADNTCGSSSTSCITVSLINPSGGTQTFNNTSTSRTGSTQSFVVPTCVSTLTIEAWGAKGGGSNGGLGAYIKGDVTVTPGETLTLMVGQMGEVTSQGSAYGAGGGGGTFVYRDATDALPLMAAGGGGGQAQGSNGGGGSGTATPTSGSGSGSGSGGSGGNGGSGGVDVGDYSTGGGGCGWLTNGQDGLYIRNPEGKGGQAPRNGGVGGLFTHPNGYSGGHGGYGGGGGMSDNSGAGGGGGGYNGGGGGNNYSPWGSGGGGGSYNGGTNQTNQSGVNTSHGKVTFSW